MKNADPTTEIIQECLAVRIRLVARHISALYDQAVLEFDLTIAQLNLMAALGKKGPCSLRELGDTLQLDRSTVSRNLDLLRNKGLIDVVSSDAKGIREVALSSAGKEKIKAALPAWRNAQKTALELLGEDGKRALKQASGKVWTPPV